MSMFDEHPPTFVVTPGHQMEAAYVNVRTGDDMRFACECGWRSPSSFRPEHALDLGDGTLAAHQADAHLAAHGPAHWVTR